MKKNVFFGLLTLLMVLTGCQTPNFTDVVVSVDTEINGATFSDDYDDVDYVRGVYSKALMATGKVEALDGDRKYVIRRQSSSEKVAAMLQEAMDKANAELKNYKSQNRSVLRAVYSYQFGSDPQKELKSPNYGTSYTEADVEGVVIKYRLNLNLTEEETLATFKEMTKGFAVNYYNVETGKVESKSLTFDETFEAQYSAKTLSKAGYIWYIEPKEAGVVPTVGVRLLIIMQTTAEVSFKDGRKGIVNMGKQYAGDESSKLWFQEQHMPKLCSLDNRLGIQGYIYTMGWDTEMQDYRQTSKE